MKKACFLFFYFLSISVFGQELESNVNKKIMVSLPKEARIVGLGDPTHQERTITNYRIDLIKKLVTEKGFGVIAIEGNLYELYNAHQDYLQNKDYSSYEHAMYSQLNSTEMEDLYDFVYNENQRGNPVHITGFDVNFSGNAFARMMEKDLVPLKMISEKEKRDFIKTLKTASIVNLKALFRNDRKVKQKIITYSNKILASYSPKNRDDYFFQQALKSMVFNFTPEKQHESGSNMRDKTMALNVSFLKEQFPEEKIILFGSSTHLLKNTKAIEDDYFQNDRTTLGQELETQFGNEYFFIAYTSLSGHRFNAFGNPNLLPKTIDNSIEATMNAQVVSKVDFINSQLKPLGKKVNCRFLGHSFELMNLWEVMDCLVLVKNVEPFEIKKIKK